MKFHRFRSLCLSLVLVFLACQTMADELGSDTDIDDRVDATTLNGKVMCGYQGWFNCEGDGANLGWTHWSRHRHKTMGPGNVVVDLWPDVSELDSDERFATGFKHADGRIAEVFSSSNKKTVLRHLSWMREYGIDGAFVQRFANGLHRPAMRNHKDQVLSHVREGASRSGRVFAVMYDLSGLRAGQVSTVREDWGRLVSEQRITTDDSYLHHKGKPVVAVWGVGFNDNRAYSLDECRELVRWLKSQGCCVMLGVPSFWRDGNRDSVDDPTLIETMELADIISPWTIGRYRTPSQATRHADTVWRHDRLWCENKQLDFLPVVYPGFSWHNLKGEELDAIPRLKGQFLWSQMIGAKQAGCSMIYVAMFDEVDEGTAIFKCTDRPPTGNGGRFLSFDGMPNDHYLKIVGHGARMLRGETDLSESLPSPLPSPPLITSEHQGQVE